MSIGFARMVRAASRRRASPPSLFQRWSAMEVSAFGSTHAATLAAPCPAGTTIVVELLDDPSRFYSAVDNAGNVYTVVTSIANTAYDKRGVWLVCANVVGTPTIITVSTWWDSGFTNPANTSLRLYTTCWYDLTATLGGTAQALEFAAASSATGTITTPVDNCVMFMLVNTSPSRTPVVVAPSTLYRLDFQSGVPYTGAVSQHSAFRLCESAGENTIQTTWTPEGNAVTRVFSMALRPTPA